MLGCFSKRIISAEPRHQNRLKSARVGNVSLRSGPHRLRGRPCRAAATGGSGQFAAAVDQTGDVTEYVSLIATGTSSIHVSAVFNRVDLDAETDNLFGLLLDAQDAAGATLGTALMPLSRDGDVGSWEPLQTNLALPAGTTQVRVQLNAFENVFADPVSPEFDGHYLDDVQVWVSP